MAEIKTLDEYQEAARKTAIYPEQDAIVYPVLGLNGEAGELAEKTKKVLRDNNRVFDEEHKLAMALELGDVLWYVASLAHDLGYSLSNIAGMNLYKLADRANRNQLHGNGDNR